MSDSASVSSTGSRMSTIDDDWEIPPPPEKRSSMAEATVRSSGSFSERSGNSGDLEVVNVGDGNGNGNGEGVEVEYEDDDGAKHRRFCCICVALVCVVVLLVSIVVPVTKSGQRNNTNSAVQTAAEYNQLWEDHCFQPDLCTDSVLDREAKDDNGAHTCRARLKWLMDVSGLSRFDACFQLSTAEFPTTCGPCDPTGQAQARNDTPTVRDYVDEHFCYQPQICTPAVLDTLAGVPPERFPCRDRIEWLQNNEGKSLGQACFQVAINEFPGECGGCDPTGGTGTWVEGDALSASNPAINVGGTYSNSGDNSEEESGVGGDTGGNAGGAPSNSGDDEEEESGVGGNSGGNSGSEPSGSNSLTSPPDTPLPTGMPTPPPSPGATPPPTQGMATPPPTPRPTTPPGDTYPHNEYTGSPFSILDPVNDLNMLTFDRPQSSRPSGRFQIPQSAYPTNAWYQNMLQLRDDDVPTDNHRAYPIPYVVDANGRIPGLRVHTTRNIATDTGVTLTVDPPYALTLGATEDIHGRGVDMGGIKTYVVTKTNELGFTMQWDYTEMRSSIVRGMPYATMTYPGGLSSTGPSGLRVLPTVVAEFPFDGTLTVDGNSEIDCVNNLFHVQNDVSITFDSGLTWMVFISQEADFQCSRTSGLSLVLQAVNLRENPNADFIMRLGLIVPPVDNSGVALPTDENFKQSYATLLREHADVYPGEDASVSLDVDSTTMQASITLNWDAKRMDGSSDTSKLLTFALPHHQDKLGVLDQFCTASLLGRVCPVEGPTWTIIESLPAVSFNAPRRPLPRHIRVLAESVKVDLTFQIPENFQIGAGDTYFGAKYMAKVARVAVIAKELQTICSSPDNEYVSACQSSDIPTDGEIDDAVSHLRGVLDVWFGGSAEAPFVYDDAWGGVVSCGCYYENGHCTNAYPNCPGLIDQGLNFGNGFYNDHHFHYGYYIYASAVVASFDPQWGRDNFENVLLLVRDIANPSRQDSSFPLFRHKDWYFGSSWASGITQPLFPNGMNQESSSEAIASYESVALFGRTMRSAFDSVGLTSESTVSDEVYKIGLAMTATELRSTNRYWHVTQEKKVYPPEYQKPAVGILWSTMIQFGTWFGNNPYLIYGIQLLPFTPIAEYRDESDWAREVFGPLSASCDGRCVSEGWSVQVLALLATLGHIDYAVNQALSLPSFVFRSPGGGGHSKSNTVWYLSTRPQVSNPYPFDENIRPLWDGESVQMNCGQPSTCTDQVLETSAVDNAGGYTCGERIRYLKNAEGMTEFNACIRIAVTEFPDECGPCDPRQRRLGQS